MALEIIPGNLLAYQQLLPGTFQHVDKLTAKRRTDPELRNPWIYTADGQLYTVRRGKVLWGITREPQNLVLQHLHEAYRQLTSTGNYFPDAKEARTSLDDPNTVVSDVGGLDLISGIPEYGHFVVDPRNLSKLSSQQLTVAQRIFGPDENNFRRNMEYCSRVKTAPFIHVLTPDYVRTTLQSNRERFLARASLSGGVKGNFTFQADSRTIDDHYALYGKRRILADQRRQRRKSVVPSARPDIEGLIRLLCPK